MRWNWQQANWPNFTWDEACLTPYESRFLHETGLLFGSYLHLAENDKSQLKIDLISNEALMTSKIEGEYLNRDSLQSSILRQFGLSADAKKIPPAEQGIAEMMVDLYRTWAEPLTEKILLSWHQSLMQGAFNQTMVGHWRSDSEPMQIISGSVAKPQVHFEAPPSKQVPQEMARFIDWFNKTQTSLPIITRAGIAHLYFESIHPFADGNGRIGRAIAEKALAQGLKQPSLIALSQTIETRRKNYYEALGQASRTLAVSDWLYWFAETVLAARETTQTWIEFLIAKTKLYDKFAERLNLRQQKVLARVFREGPKGFSGGLSAKNYITITGAAHATATRDLQDLVELGVLTSTGKLRYTRYWLNLSSA